MGPIRSLGIDVIKWVGARVKGRKNELKGKGAVIGAKTKSMAVRFSLL